MSGVIFRVLEKETVIAFDFDRDDGTTVQGIIRIVRVNGRTGIDYLSTPRLTQEEKDMLERKLFEKD